MNRYAAHCYATMICNNLLVKKSLWRDLLLLTALGERAIIVITSLFSMSYPETFLSVKYILHYMLPTSISNKASILVYIEFEILNFSMKSHSFHSSICFSIATHDRFQNSSSGFAEMIHGFLYQRNMKKAYACYNIKYFNCVLIQLESITNKLI